MCDEITIDNALVAKAECWSYEDESRLIFYDKEKLDSDYVTLDGFPVKAVYFGSRVDADTETALRKLLKAHHIPLYKMRFCSEDITKLKAIKF